MDFILKTGLFWFGIGVIFYAYLGYGILLFLLLKIKRQKGTIAEGNKETLNSAKVTFVVCAYNEADWIEEKIANSLALKYPEQHLRFIFVTDGSTDGTPECARAFFEKNAGNITWVVMHTPERKGKIAAFQRAMEQYGQWEGQHIIVSTDANTLLNTEALQNMIRHFQEPTTGAVAGEKRIRMGDKEAASSAGEGIYWRYESTLKKWDSDLWSVVGAAGELFAFRSDIYETVPPDTIVEDFYLTMRIAQKGYRVVYEPEAYAVETSSASVQEEMKRKVRIAAGGLQAMIRLAPLLNVFRYGTLSFQYISHRVLRWTLAPFFLPVIFVVNILLALDGYIFYQWIFAGQVLFYLFALLGYIFEQRQVKIKAFFIPYYFCLMNYAMYAGLLRLMKGNQSVVWEKSKRAV